MSTRRTKPVILLVLLIALLATALIKPGRIAAVVLVAGNAQSGDGPMTYDRV